MDQVNYELVIAHILVAYSSGTAESSYIPAIRKAAAIAGSGEFCYRRSRDSMGFTVAEVFLASILMRYVAIAGQNILPSKN